VAKIWQSKSAWVRITLPVRASWQYNAGHIDGIGPGLNCVSAHEADVVI
jgi:hypothetical protein